MARGRWWRTASRTHSGCVSRQAEYGASPVAQFVAVLDKADRIEEPDPVPHSLSGLADASGELRHRERPSVEQAAQQVQAPVAPHGGLKVRALIRHVRKAGAPAARGR